MTHALVATLAVCVLACSTTMLSVMLALALTHDGRDE